MSFKEQLEKDMQAFFCSDEFSEQHSINSDIVECVLMLSDKDEEHTANNKKGITTSYSSVIVNSNLLTETPVVGDYLKLDNELFTVMEASCVEGMCYIDLSMPVGKFNKRIVIQKDNGVKKVNGVKVPDWVDVHTCNAYIRHISAEEIQQLGTTLSKDTLFVKVPYFDKVTSKMRMLFKDKFYNIVSVDNLEEKNVFLDLIVESCD